MIRIYETEATAVGDGRAGEAMSHDRRLQVNLSRPPEMGGGPEESGTNPEQLFAAGYAACFHSALRSIGRRGRQDVDDSAVTARVALLKGEDGTFSLDVKLVVELPGVDEATAREMVEQAHHVCPYSRAIAGNVNVRRSVRS
ncbi:MAG: Ohr family peroxiredoxin [Propionibacteriales bacterium]|nr:Ohr family peroxiredoxin [Propionibacteriales bacterium]